MILFKLCVGLLAWLLLYRRCILRPQIQEIRRKLELPEFQGTAHHQSLQFAFTNLRRRWARLRIWILLLGILLAGWLLWSRSA